MPRRREVTKRETTPDPKYHSRLLAKFVNGLLRQGKKSTAEHIMYETLEIIGGRTKEDPLKIFEKAMEAAKPLIEVKSRRVGGSTYQVPVEIRPERRTSLSIRWLISYAKGRGGKSMQAKLAEEILDAANGRGGAVKKKEDTHRMADANKAFAHYRW
ncbi:MAG: 30S ribosomal protein S7 [Deltaproteobacteria bacterium]|nr:30S ribosomal protein S7 [Deltaproteobacteria bacterium]